MRFKSIVSLALSVVILFSSVGSAKAVEGTNAAYFAKGSFWDQMLFGLVTGAVEWPFGDAVQDIAAVVCGEICPSSEDGLHRTSRAGLLGRPTGFHPDVGRYGVAVCDHCGNEFKLYSEDLSERGRGFVDGLENTTVSSPVVIPDGYMLYNGVGLPNIESVWTNKDTYPFAAIFLHSSHGYTLLISGSPIKVDSGVWCAYSPHRRYLVSTAGEWVLKTNGYDSSSYYPFDSSYSPWGSHDIYDKDGILFSVASDPVDPNAPEADPSVSNVTSRPTSVMDVIDQWNKDNPISTNSTTINYYIMPTGTEDLYSPALYDEEELVYTDPVTGTEYLTNGWTYDYLTRCYTLDMADGFTIGDAAIDTIKLTYGDELLTVDHYSGGSLIRSDEYNYVMASGSECGLNGHSYTYENIKEPTCTAMGERKYTCSVCGDQYAENVPASGHTHVFSILKEATCTAAGIGLYSCSSCGSEYTESIPATNHTGQLIETVPSEFDENGVLISRGYSVYECSVCGTQYTVQDEISTDDGDWFSFMGDLLKSFLKTIVTALGAGLSKLFSAIADFFSWIFGFLSETVLSGIKNFFNAFGDDSSIFDGFRQENEDGSSTVALPSGVATVFQFVSGTILLLPDDLRLVLIFGVAALFLIAVFKSRP